jgi:predicted nucleotidyltransferase
MDTYNEKWTLMERDIFSMLCKQAGERLSQREIAKLLKVSPTSVSGPLKKLLKRRLISLDKTKTINFISFNRDYRKAIELKRAENLKNIYISGLSEHLESVLPGGTIILFGSYSRGEDTDASDIDIAVFGRKQKGLDLQKYEAMLHRKINVNYYDSWGTIDVHLKNNILGGILLIGSVEL